METGNTIGNSILTVMGGGVLVALINKLIVSRDKKVDLTAKLMERLTQVETELRRDIKQVETELDNWKLKYYTLFDEHHKVLLELRSTTQERDHFKVENGVLREKLAKYDKRFDDLNSKLNKLQKSNQ